jgi:hypothetical protein
VWEVGSVRLGCLAVAVDGAEMRWCFEMAGNFVKVEFGPSSWRETL